MGKKNKRAVAKVPHPYQIEALEKALSQNVILCLPTGSGKTFIAIMVIKEYSDVLNIPYSRGGKRAFFLVPTKVLVDQQATSIQTETTFDVGRFSGESKDDSGVIIDHWTKEYWDIIFEQYQVFVMTRKIFLDLLNSGFIAHSSIATIIFDEAHRGAPNAKGKLTGDDYVSIMKSLKEKGHSSIRIVGLTASLINNRWVCDDKMGQMISIIEGVYDSEVFFPECSRNFKGREIVWCYKQMGAEDNDRQSIPLALITLAYQIPVIKGSSAGAADDLDYVPLSFLLQNGAIPVNPAQLKKTFEGLARICCEFGPWSLNQSLIFIVKSFKSVCQQINHLKSSFIQVIELVRKTLEDFQLLVQNKLATYGKGRDLLAGIPDKMIRLLQCLYEFNEKAKTSGDAVSAIVFVERRLDAFALSKWLNGVSRCIPEYNFIKCDFTVGSASFTPFPFNGLLHSSQGRVIKDFKDKKLNIIVATSVLEEGLDITHCNLIIRYDYTPTFRAYVQSKGRARSKEACFVFFASETDHTITEQDIQKFRLTEDRLHEYQRPLHAVEHSLINYDVFLKTSEGAILPYNECKNRVLFYCDHLPGDYFMSKMPKTKIEEISCRPSEDSKLFRCHLNLPKLSRLHSLTISGRKCSTEAEAEMDAYYETVKILWGYGELNDAFRPLDNKTLINNLLEQYKLGVNKTELKEWEEECRAIRKAWNANKKNKRDGSPDFPPKPGTSKKRRLYPQMYSKALMGYQSLNSPCWLYKVTLKTESSCFGILGLITFNLLPLNELQDKLSIFSTKDELKVSIELVRPITVTEDVLKDIRNFQDYIYTGCLKIGLNNERQNSKIYFTSSDSSYHLLFIFLTNENTIDYTVLKQQYQRRPIIPEDYSKLKGALISKNYAGNNRSLWLVAEVDHSMSPASKFPAPGFDTYADYYRSTYGVTSIDSNQPLVACYPAPTETYYPLKLFKVFKKSKKDALLVHLIPGICQFEYFSGKHVQMVYTIPAITTALNNLLMADEIRKRLCSEIGYGLSETPDDIKLTWDRKRCTNFVPLNAKITKVSAEVSEPVDLSFVTCKRYVNPSLTRTASTLSLDVIPGTNENDTNDSSGNENEEEDEDEDDSDNDSLAGVGSDGNAAQSMSKPFNPEVLNSSKSNQTSRPAVEIFHTGTTTLFSKKPAPTIVPVSWSDSDINFAAYFEKLAASFNADSSSYIQDQADDEMEAPVNNAIEVNDFSKENAIIISTDSIYADHLKLHKYGLPPELIMEAMTTKRSNSLRNLERLEIIGDSFLKYFVSACLFLKLHDLDEARITYLKMHLISNFNLLHLARSKQIAQQIIDKTFFPRQNWLPPFYTSIEQDFTHQEMSDKTVADMAEAMIGAHLTFLGEDVTIRFLQWLGMPLFNGDDNIRVHPSSNNRYLPLYDDVLPLENRQEIMKIWKCSNLPKLEDKLKYTFKRKDLLIEALTHPSWCKSQLNSYQRLEFLGDAILDYLITFYVYDHPNYGHLTPGDVTYIRQAMVNNDYFATIAMVNDFHKHLFHFSSTLYSSIQEFHLQLYNNDLLDGNTLKLGSFLLDNLSSLDNDILAEAPKALGDIFESIAGAIYLDSGNSLATVWRVYSKFIGNEIDFFCANVPKSPFVRLFESYPNTKFISEKMSDPKQNRKRYNLVVNDQWSFTVNEEELKKEGMTKRKEKMALVLSALNKMSKLENPLSNGL